MSSASGAENPEIEAKVTPTLGGERESLVASDRLAPFSSLHLARCALNIEFPHHTTKVKQGTVTDAVLLARYRAKQRSMRRTALELAQLEIDLKKRVGFNEGMEIPGEGILYWTTKGAQRKSRTNWMKMVEDYKIPEEKLREYQKNAGHRRFFFRRKAHLPSGIDKLVPPNSPGEETGFDDDF